MTVCRSHAARSILLAFLLSGATHAQDGARAPESVGIDFAGMNVVTRVIEQTYPLGNTPVVVLANRFGPVVVDGWDDAVVHLTITARVGAEDEDAAHRVAQLIDIATTHETGRLDLRTTLPPPEELGRAGYAVSYSAHVPRGTSLTVENTFGDTSINGVRGGTSIESRYGVVRLSNLAGPVRVRARGDFDLSADSLKDGGFFLLRGTQASFRSVHGTLHVNNYLGSVTLRPLQVSEADIVSESGPIHVYLPEGPPPSIEARVDFGRIESEVSLNRDVWGRSELAELVSPRANQRISVQSSFDNVYIYRPVSLAPLAEPAASSERVRDELSHTVELPRGRPIRIDAAVGNVVVEGVADDRLIVTASRRARVRDVANARIALEGLSLEVIPDGELLRIVSTVREDMDALGSLDYGIDLNIRCPAEAPVAVYANQGDTRVSQLTGTVSVDQGTGTLHAAGLSGKSVLTNHGGSVVVEDSPGALTITATGGEARLERVGGSADVTVRDGRTVIDTPGAGLVVRTTGGDVRIVALDGVQGDYDVRVEDGDISLVTPSTSSATFFMDATEGSVECAFQVTGTMERSRHKFQGLLNDGKYRVLLETLRGDIRVD